MNANTIHLQHKILLNIARNKTARQRVNNKIYCKKVLLVPEPSNHSMLTKCSTLNYSSKTNIENFINFRMERPLNYR